MRTIAVTGLVLYRLAFTLTLPVYYLIALAIWVVTSPFDRRRRIINHGFFMLWFNAWARASPFWRVELSGEKLIRRDRQYIFVCNHQSLLDSLLLNSLWIPFKAIGKSETFKKPFFGWSLYFLRFIKIEPGSKESILRMFELARARINEGNSLVSYPEGQRNTDGVISEFKHGAFIIAKEHKLPIVPLVFCGTRYAFPDDIKNFRCFQTVCMKVLAPIPYESFANLTPHQAAEMVRNAMIKEQAALENRLQLARSGGVLDRAA